jgi:hypothetical protein
VAVIESGIAASSQQVVETSGAARTVLTQRGVPFSVSATTGTIAAALAANASVFAMRLDPGATVNVFIERIRLQYTTLVAFTVPLTAGRRLELYRGSGAATSGGTSIPAAAKKSSTSVASECDLAQGGDIRIATTGALTVTGITFETPPVKTMHLVHVGAAGGYAERVWELHASESAPAQLQPGQLIAIRTPAAFDAAGTWQLGIDVDWHEGAAI